MGKLRDYDVGTFHILCYACITKLHEESFTMGHALMTLEPPGEGSSQMREPPGEGASR